MIAEDLGQLEASAAAFADLIETLPPELLKSGDWGPREVLAHLVFSFELRVSCMAAVAEGRKPPLFRGTVEEHNARAVSENAGASRAELLERFRAAVKAFTALAARPELQAVPFRSRAGSAPENLAQAVRGGVGHVRGHTRDVRRMAKHAGK